MDTFLNSRSTHQTFQMASLSTPSVRDTLLVSRRLRMTSTLALLPQIREWQPQDSFVGIHYSVNTWLYRGKARLRLKRGPLLYYEIFSASLQEQILAEFQGRRGVLMS